MDGSYFFQYCKISLYLNIAALGGSCVVKFSIFVHHWRAFSLLCIAIVFVRWFTCEEADGEIDDFDCFSSKLESPLVALDYVKTRWCCS